MILKQNTFNLVSSVSSSEISSASLSNPFRESGTSRNWKSQNFDKGATSCTWVCLWLITCHGSLISIGQLTMCGTSAEVPWSLGFYSRGAGFRAVGFSLPSPSPLPRFLPRPLAPGSARLKNPRWRSINERNGFSAMKPPVTACKKATFTRLAWFGRALFLRLHENEKPSFQISPV